MIGHLQGFYAVMAISIALSLIAVVLTECPI